MKTVFHLSLQRPCISHPDIAFEAIHTKVCICDHRVVQLDTTANSVCIIDVLDLVLLLSASRSPPKRSSHGHCCLCASLCHQCRGAVWPKKYMEMMFENGVDQNSYTETYATIRFFINNSRWKNIPFYEKRMEFVKEQIRLA